jgi:hypothetical protein
MPLHSGSRGITLRGIKLTTEYWRKEKALIKVKKCGLFGHLMECEKKWDMLCGSILGSGHEWSAAVLHTSTNQNSHTSCQ